MNNMERVVRIRPTPGYEIPASRRRILPRRLHRDVIAEYCPVCLGRQIGERLASGQPVWYCRECGNEW